jgi:hypothetical protein
VKGPFAVQPNIHEHPVVNHLEGQREGQLTIRVLDPIADGNARNRRIKQHKRSEKRKRFHRYLK